MQPGAEIYRGTELALVNRRAQRQLIQCEGSRGNFRKPSRIAFDVPATRRTA